MQEVLAVLYAFQSKRLLLNSILNSSIFASAHFLSSIVVVLSYDPRMAKFIKFLKT